MGALSRLLSMASRKRVAEEPLSSSEERCGQSTADVGQCQLGRRAYYKGSTTQYCNEVLMPIGRSKGRSLVVYRDESENPTDAKVYIDDVRRNDDFLELEYKLCPNFAFPKTVVRRALTMLATNMGDFGMTSDEKADWLVCLLRRIRNLNRVVSQALTKHAKWAHSLPWVPASVLQAKPPAATSQRSAKGASTQHPSTRKGDRIYGFSFELLLGWRCPVDDLSDRRKEWSQPLTVASDADDSDLVRIAFGDSDTVDLEWLTVGQLRSRMRQDQKPPTNVPLFEGTHKVTHHKIRVTQRVDRSLLMQITEQNKMVCMVKMSMFGRIENEHAQVESDHPACVGASKLLVPIAKAFCDGSLSREELYQARDASLAKLLPPEASRRGRGGSTAVMKKPVCGGARSTSLVPRTRLREKASPLDLVGVEADQDDGATSQEDGQPEPLGPEDRGPQWLVDSHMDAPPAEDMLDTWR